jgi:hypothetical protein
MTMMNSKDEKSDSKATWATPQGIAVIITAITGCIAAIGAIVVPIYLANQKETAVPIEVSASAPAALMDTFTPVIATVDPITYAFTPAPADTLPVPPAYTFTNTVVFIPTFTHTPTSVPALRTEWIEGRVLSIDLPGWAPSPVRGSVTFNKNSEIASTGTITVQLSVRNESSTQWVESTPVALLTLGQGERLCSISPAEFNSANYYLGFQAHCANQVGCSYNIENNRLWVTIIGVGILIAPQGVQCP